jgi:hypothetical protein
MREGMHATDARRDARQPLEARVFRESFLSFLHRGVLQHGDPEHCWSQVLSVFLQTCIGNSLALLICIPLTLDKQRTRIRGPPDLHPLDVG